MILASPGKRLMIPVYGYDIENTRSRRMSDHIDQLKALAADARTRAHAPYSRFRVGAAVLDDAGNLHAGCNVENASFPEGNCAETAAIAAMVVGGGRTIRELVVFGGRDAIGPCAPCGGCRQRIAEFADADTRVWLVNASGAFEAWSADRLLPGSFRFDDGGSEND
jgi:cytidine deaminase